MAHILNRILFPLCILIVGFFSGAELTELCPPIDLIRPCSCREAWKEKYNELRCGGITDVETLEGVVQNTGGYELGGFDLVNSRLTYLPTEIFTIDGLKAIKVSSTTLTLGTLFDRQPPENNAVEYVEIADTRQIQKLDLKYFSALKNLTSVFFFVNPGLQFDDKFIEYMPNSLVSVRARNCETGRIADGAFAKLKHLEEIVVMKDTIRELKRSMFPTPAKLYTFDFRKNHLTSLPEDLFDDMPNLLRIYLSGNQLTTVSEATFGRITPQLWTLDVGSNPIHCTCDILWINQPDSRPDKLIGSCEEPTIVSGKDIVELQPQDFDDC